MIKQQKQTPTFQSIHIDALFLMVEYSSIKYDKCLRCIALHSLDLCMFLKNTTLVFYKTVFVISKKLQPNRQARAGSPCVLQTGV